MSKKKKTNLLEVFVGANLNSFHYYAYEINPGEGVTIDFYKYCMIIVTPASTTKYFATTPDYLYQTYEYLLGIYGKEKIKFHESHCSF